MIYTILYNFKTFFSFFCFFVGQKFDISLFEHVCIYLNCSLCDLILTLRHITIFVLFFCVAPLHFLIWVDFDYQQRFVSLLWNISHQICSDWLMSTVSFLISYNVTVCQIPAGPALLREDEAGIWSVLSLMTFLGHVWLFSLKLLIHKPWVSPESPELNHHYF